MTRSLYLRVVSACTFILFFAGAIPSQGQDGKLRLHVKPKQTYVFVDGQALSEASRHQLIRLPAGEHKVELRNYGYVPETHTVTISPDQVTDLDVSLSPDSRPVTGPVGALHFEGPSSAAVLLNGKTPDFFVGHVDEFNHQWWWHQELVVPPGSYDVTVLRRDKPAWSKTVVVPANQRVVINTYKDTVKTVDWPRGAKVSSLPRFTVGTASARVAVAKPTAELSASASQINCGDSSQLKWSSTDAPAVSISPVGTVSSSGDQAVQPKQTTAYELTALGPGGAATATTTVNVNTAVQAGLGLAPSEVRYKRVGNKTVQEGSATLSWTSGNASKISIEGLGEVAAQGTRELQIAPRRTDRGAVDETVTYTLTATNDCGGSATQTASLHIAGEIGGPIDLSIRSVFFPTDLPAPGAAHTGLLASEQATLKNIAAQFKEYLGTSGDARLTLSGYADRRGPSAYNKKLSDRRVQLVKAFLIEQGVPASALETYAYGNDQNLSAEDVKQLLELNPALSAADRRRALARLETTVLAHNRRVDLTLSTTGQQSARLYPYGSGDVLKLIDRNKPNIGLQPELAASK